MTLSLQVLTEPLGGSPLSIAARARELPEWYPPLPRGAREWDEYAAGVRESVAADWYEALAPAIDLTASGAAAARLARVRDENGVVITTGQQPGLFGGPLMTLVKALTARALADELEALIKRPVAPVFWAATDDADFDEASVVGIAIHGGAQELRHARTAPAGLRMSDVQLGPDVQALAERLRGACGSVPHPEFLESALRAYKPGATVGGAYVRMLRDVMEPLGIAVLDASHPAVARQAGEVLGAAAARAGKVERALAERSRRIAERGYDPQVEEVTGLSLVFTREDGVKRRLGVAEAEATRGADENLLSATVLLRPIVERCILPTATYVGGPGEVAYFAQVSAVAEALGVPVPRVVPRWSTTIVEPRIQELLESLNVTRGDLASHAAESKIAHALVPPEVAAALVQLRDGIRRGVESLGAAAGDLVDRRVLTGLDASLMHKLERGERRILAAVKRRERAALERLGTVRGALAPFGGRQERTLSYVPFLSRWGLPLVDAMHEAARAHVRGLLGETPVPELKARAAVPQPG